MILVGSGLEVAYGDCRRRVECGFPGYVSRYGWVVGTGSEVEMVGVGVVEVDAGL